MAKLLNHFWTILSLAIFYIFSTFSYSFYRYHSYTRSLQLQCTFNSTLFQNHSSDSPTISASCDSGYTDRQPPRCELHLWSTRTLQPVPPSIVRSLSLDPCLRYVEQEQTLILCASVHHMLLGRFDVISIDLCYASTSLLVVPDVELKT
ncbi:hypothetical protein ACS0TY_034200 [Phlomoides rotata]